jgi:hypothetical protein
MDGNECRAFVGYLGDAVCHGMAGITWYGALSKFVFGVPAWQKSACQAY